MKRLAAMVALGALTMGAAAGCAKSAESAGQNEVQASGALGGTPSVPGTAGPTTTKATGTSGTTPKGSTTSKPSTSTPGIPSIPDLPSIPDIPDIPGGGGQLQKCLDLANAYSQIFLPLSTGSPSADDIAKATAAIDQIKSQVPANIQADLDTLASGIKGANGIEGLGQFFSTPEFTKANDEVTDYLTSECTKAGNGA